MATQKTESSPDEARILVHGEELSHTEILKQLERIASCTYFRNSKRYPSFLRFVVEHTLAGNTDVLKERTLGTEVFARPSEYDTNADPIVRVTAGEIRKRLAQYYQVPGHEHELRIDLPLGSYVPHFLPAALAAQILAHETGDHSADSSILHDAIEEHEAIYTDHPPLTSDHEALQQAHQAAESAGGRMRAMLFTGLAIILILGIAVFTVNLLRNRAKNQAIRAFWQPMFSTSSPVLIVIGVHSLDKKGGLPTGTAADVTQNPQQSVLSTLEQSDMVPVSDIVSYSKLTNLITRRSHTYQTQGSANTSLQDLLHGPVILIGGTDNIWTMRLTSALRYGFFFDGGWKYGIRDSKHPSTSWIVDFEQPVLNNSRDYAIVASYFDPTIEQHVLVAAGIGKNGTVAASDFLTVEKYMSSWSPQGKLSGKKNIELVLSTEILDGQPGPPHVLASYSW